MSTPLGKQEPYYPLKLLQAEYKVMICSGEFLVENRKCYLDLLEIFEYYN